MSSKSFQYLHCYKKKQRNHLKPENPDKLMRPILIGPNWFDDAICELLIDKCDAIGGRRIFLDE